ncbi:MAG: ABC transporter permease [Desulfobacteraceae bacterium]|nr:ABC transporter permease [Desulfobacteraceae bacterium]MCF8035232.1 ABC transporter permease [Desulfobacteraceae bacterium]
MDIKIAWRNIWRNPRRTIIIMTAVIIGIWSMIFLTAFMRGMVVDMIENGIATLTGDVKIYASGFRSDPALENRIRNPGPLAEKVQANLPADAHMAARIRVSAIAQNARHSAGVTLVGIDPAEEAGVSFIGDGVATGQMIRPGNPVDIVVGKALLEKFETKIGNKLILMSEDAAHEMASRAFRIRGIFSAELEATEKRFVFVSKSAARGMLQIGADVSEISVMLENHDRADAVAEKIAAAIDTEAYEVRTWKELKPMLKAYINIFDGYIILWYLVVFAAMVFGIINTTLMAVFERMREFGLLKALGMRPWRILRAVLIETAFILLIGAAAGNTLAFSMVYAIGQRGIDLSMFAAGFEYAGMSSVIRPEIFAGDVVLANAVVICLGLVVSAYPAARAARITPVEAMARN